MPGTVYRSCSVYWKSGTIPPMRTGKTAIMGGLGLILGLCRAATADMSHDQALEAVRSGKILPILTIIEMVEREYNGRVVEVELENDEDGHGGQNGQNGEVGFTYEINMVTDEGRLLELMVDAATGEVIGLGGRGIGGDRD